MNNKWFNLSFTFRNEFPCFSVLRITVTGTKATTNNKGDKESPANIPRLILTFPSLFFPENKTVPQLCVLLLSSSTMFLTVPTSSRVFCIQLWGTMPYAFRKSTNSTFRIVFLLLLFLTNALSIKSWSFVPLVFLSTTFLFLCNSFCLFKWT